MKQTAVEFYAKGLENLQCNSLEKNDYEIAKQKQRLFEKAKQMEKEQSLNFAKHCLDKAKDLDVRTAFLNVEQYYKRNL